MINAVAAREVLSVKGRALPLVILLSVLSALVFPCASLADESPPMTLSKASFTLAVGVTHQLKVGFRSDVRNRTIRWSSSDKSIATVSSNGDVRGVKSGIAIIAAQIEGYEAHTQVTVVTLPSKVAINVSSAIVHVGQSSALYARITPAHSEYQSVKWHSGNPKVATVDQDGVVTGRSKGRTAIYATAVNGKRASMTLTVVVPVERITLSRDSFAVDKGKSVRLRSNVYPGNANDKKVYWSSSDPRVASVSSSGTVIGRDAGVAIIAARMSNGVTAECEVTVRIPVSGVKLNLKSATLASEGGTVSLAAVVSPANATDKRIAWKSSNASVARVDANGVVTAFAAGRATVTATSANGKKASVAIAVIRAVTGLKLSAADLTLKYGQSVAIKAEATPANAGDKRIAWTSSDRKVAVVSDTGVITARGAGSCVVTATARSGVNLSERINITVTSGANKVIALTFDDGPAASTLKILDTLRNYNVNATFFVVGKKVLLKPDIIKRMAADGHQIGNHSYTHADFFNLKDDAIRKEVDLTDAVILKTVGITPRVIRAPYNNANARIAKLFNRPFVVSENSAGDQTNRNAAYVYNYVVSHARDGQVVLLHDVYPTTAEAIEKIIPRLITEGYDFVTVSELIAIRGTNADTMIFP